MAELKMCMDDISIRVSSMVTKADFTQIGDRLVAQSLELHQLRGKMSGSEESLRKLQTSEDKCMAANLALKTETVNRQQPASAMSTNIASLVKIKTF